MSEREEENLGDAISISSSLYGILATCFSGEPSRRTIARLKGELEALGQARGGWDEPEVWQGVENLSDSLKHFKIKEGARDYAALFLGGGDGSVCPSESCYIDGAMYGPSTLRIMELYKNAGFVKEVSFKEPDDHIAVEFVFRFLSGLDISETMADAGPDLVVQHGFIRDHLAAWIPLFAKHVESLAATGFYRAAASLSDALVRADLRLHERILGEGAGTSPA